MTDVVFVFEVHQPFRLRKGFFWERSMFRRVDKEGLFDFYFDDAKNKEIFKRACRKCYFPSNEILLGLVDKHRGDKRSLKVSFSISGIFLEQCERYSPDLLESFKQLSETGHVEFLEQTYYHSLVGLYPVRDEFIRQVMMHRQAMKDLLHAEPLTFENTELLYNNAIAKTVEEMGYIGIFTEGVDRILKGRSPNYVYKAKKCEKIKVLLRNYKLTDDIGFRFSTKDWIEWPLTASKYADWLSSTQGQCITIFPDYETFGEHHWPETGIHDFLKHLPEEILMHENLDMATPSEVLVKHRAVGEIDIPELGGTISWADLARDTSCWLGNTMQWAYYTSTKEIEPIVKEARNEELLRIWRHLLASDHLYYMFTAGGSPGEVHTYFNPYDTPVDAFVTAQGVILDFESRLRLQAVVANEPFLFYTGAGEKNFTEVKAWSLAGFVDAIERVDVKSIEFHNQKGDFEKWAELSLRDNRLAVKFKNLQASGVQGESLRRALRSVAKSHLTNLRKTIHGAVQWF